MPESIKVTGLREVQRTLFSFSQQLGDRVVIGSLRQGANLMKRVARGNAPFKTGKLKRGIRVAKSKIHRGKSSTDMIGVFLQIRTKKKNDPFYGRFQEAGWNTHGPRGGARSAIRAAFSSRTGRQTQRGRTNVPGKEFLHRAFLTPRSGIKLNCKVRKISIRFVG